MLFVSLVDRGRGRTFVFPRADIVVGRAADVDLVLESDTVAMQHITVRVERGEIVVRDARGKIPPRRVTANDVVQVGGIGLRFAASELALERAADPIEQQFVDRIREAPADADARMVYADWLEANGRAAHAELLRVQLELAAVRDAADPAFAAAAARLAELSEQVEPAWRALVAMAFVEECPASLAKLRPWDRRAQELAMELVCPQRWDALAATARDGVRHCGACKRDVYYCTTVEQAQSLAIRGACVAVDIRHAGERFRGDLMDPSGMVVGRPSPPMARYGDKRKL